MKKLKLIDLYKSLNDKPLDEQKTFGDLSPEEWEVEREKYGIKTHPEGHKYVSRKYDPGNEPLEIQMSETGEIYYIEPEDIEAYVSGETVIAIDPDRGADPIEANEDNSNVTGAEEDIDDEDGFVDDDDRFSGMDDVFGADLEEGTCTEQEIAEGTCGYGVDGEIGDEPAGPHLMRERFKKLANIKEVHPKDRPQYQEKKRKNKLDKYQKISSVKDIEGGSPDPTRKVKPGRVSPEERIGNSRLKDRLQQKVNKWREKNQNKVLPHEFINPNFMPGKRVDTRNKYSL